MYIAPTSSWGPTRCADGADGSLQASRKTPPPRNCRSRSRYVAALQLSAICHPILQLVMSEISTSSPMSLQAVKALALYMKEQKEAALEAVAGWLADPTATSNPTVLLVAGLLFALEENYVEALKACHGGGSMEM